MRIKRIAAAVVLAGVTVTAGTTAAHAATAPAGGWYSQNDATCAAFKAYERHPSSKRFAVMVKDAKTALHFLGVDVAWWQQDRRHHASRAELATDRAFVNLDCTDYAAQADS